MFMRTVLALSAVMFLASPAFAGSCPRHVKAIDEALQTANLSSSKKAEAQKLRDEGDKLHKEGKHSESIATLAKAENILGIK